MKAWMLYKARDLRLIDLPLPEPAEGEVRVRVRACGVCGSDLPRYFQGVNKVFPIVLGHEFSGVVDAVGPGVEGVVPGARVTAAPAIPCGRCPDCLRGNFSLCKTRSFIGSRIQGAWADYVCVPAANIVPLEETLDFVAGAFMEPLTVALHGLEFMNPTPRRDVAVVGLGTIGLLTLQAAKVWGAGTLAGFDVDDRRLENGMALGADAVYDSSDELAFRCAMDMTGGKGYDQVYETAGNPAACRACLRLAANRGSVMLIGTPSRPVEFTVEQFEQLNRKELTLRGSWMSYSAPFPGREWTDAAKLLADGSIQTEPLIDRVIPMEGLPDALLDWEKGNVCGKIMLSME